MSPPVRMRPPSAPPGRGRFLWAAGIEDTFIARPHPATGRILDEYALTEHYDRWEEDLALLAELGVSAARVGIPWHRVNPSPGVFDWEWTDRVLDRLVNTHGIEPIVDLVHYGTPLWMERAFLDPDYPARVEEYAHAYAQRYRDLCRWHTPLNEPRVCAWYAGRLGWWPPYGRSWRAFAEVLLALCRGICLTQRAIAAVQPQALFVHVDASDLYVPADLQDAALVERARLLQEIVFLPLDLVTGRVDDSHPLAGWLRGRGVSDEHLAWLRGHAVQPGILGFNMYPMFSRKEVRRAPRGGFRTRIRPCWTETLVEIARLYAARHPAAPLMITETGCNGSARRRARWIEDSRRAVEQLRAESVELVGYVYWPLFSLVGWAYQRGRHALDRYMVHMGLWDLRSSPNGLQRVRTPAVDAFQRAMRSL